MSTDPIFDLAQRAGVARADAYKVLQAIGVPLGLHAYEDGFLHILMGPNHGSLRLERLIQVWGKLPPLSPPT